MKRCYECGKKLKLWEGYFHPTLGQKVLVCSKCFEIIAVSMEKYCHYILNEYKKKNNSEINEKILNIKSKYFKWSNNSNTTH
jgi:hypothetical protein